MPRARSPAATRHASARLPPRSPRIDGRGYPLGLDRHLIAREARIITVCDFYDALTADRPYRAAMAPDQALAIMTAEVGKAIDPHCFAELRAVVTGPSPLL